MEMHVRLQEIKEAKKGDGKKKSKISGIPSLEDANWAGTAKSESTTLIICEGMSARTLAISGLTVVGRDCFGVFPLRGKPRNVRDATAKQLTENAEFVNLKKIIGLQQGVKYSDVKDLRYGRILIMADQDLDGFHIKALIVNMFAHFWPELLSLGFVQALSTPIIRLSGRINERFFSEKDFDIWRADKDLSGTKIKYYKGLGTSTSAEGKEYFREINKLTVQIRANSMEDFLTLDMAFSKEKKYVEQRKKWLLEYSASPTLPLEYGKIRNVSTSDFINRELVQFSSADIVRSIPDMRDGLKPSLRKIIFACLKKNLKTEIKVSQLSGYVSEQTAYHHGEVSLQEAIVGLAQNFCGSGNNINLLKPCGQFGTRLDNGKDHASPRYIFTSLEPITFSIFDKRDDGLLTHIEDDGMLVEPVNYFPVLPMVLINGADGIATGFSTYIPPHSPRDVIRGIEEFLDGKPITEFKPWFKGFTGKVTYDDVKKCFVTHSVYSRNDNNLTVRELPPGFSTRAFKDRLQTMIEKNVIRDYVNQSTDIEVHFDIRGYCGTDPEHDFLLTKCVHRTNMHLMTKDGIKKYDSVTDILHEFCTERLEMYERRKKLLEVQLLKKKAHADGQRDFIQSVISGERSVLGKRKRDIEDTLRHENFHSENGNYEYLFRISTSSYTSERVDELCEECKHIDEELSIVRSKSGRQLWSDDLECVKKLI